MSIKQTKRHILATKSARSMKDTKRGNAGLKGTNTLESRLMEAYQVNKELLRTDLYISIK